VLSQQGRQRSLGERQGVAEPGEGGVGGSHVGLRSLEWTGS
jgi:hypothetical protein